MKYYINNKEVPLEKLQDLTQESTWLIYEFQLMSEHLSMVAPNTPSDWCYIKNIWIPKEIKE